MPRRFARPVAGRLWRRGAPGRPASRSGPRTAWAFPAIRQTRTASAAGLRGPAAGGKSRQRAAPRRRIRRGHPPAWRSRALPPSGQRRRAAPRSPSGRRRRRHRRPHPLEAPVEVDEGAFLLEPRGHREDDVRRGGRRGEEQIVADHERARIQGCPHGRAVRVGGEHVLPDHPQRLQRPAPGGGKHLRDPKSRPCGKPGLPCLGEPGPCRRVRHLLVAGQQIGQCTHVGGALDVVLPAKRVHPSAGSGPHGAAEEGQIGQGPDAVRAVQVFGHPEPVEDRRRLRPAVDLGCADEVLRGHAGDFGDAFRG